MRQRGQLIGLRGRKQGKRQATDADLPQCVFKQLPINIQSCLVANSGSQPGLDLS
jgi:hypothetical protein